MILLSSHSHHCAKFVLANADGDGWRGGGGREQFFVAQKDLNPRPPPKPSAPSSPCFESAGLTLSASRMSEEECGSHQCRALSLHTLGTHSARLNTTQTLPHLLHFPQAEEVQEFNNKKKRIF